MPKQKIVRFKWWDKILEYRDQNNEPYVKCRDCKGFTSWGHPRPTKCKYCECERFVEK